MVKKSPTDSMLLSALHPVYKEVSLYWAVQFCREHIATN